MPRPGKKQRVNRQSAAGDVAHGEEQSLELLPIHTKDPELGDYPGEKDRKGRLVQREATSGACRVWARANCCTVRLTR